MSTYIQKAERVPFSCISGFGRCLAVGVELDVEADSGVAICLLEGFVKFTCDLLVDCVVNGVNDLLDNQRGSQRDLHHLEAELQRKDEELETLRSRVKTLEHLVKKKISFTCGHNVIRSIAELIPELCHPKVWCDGCDIDEIRGMRWRCTECYAFDLCTTCYMNDEHDLSHVFTRVLSSDKTSKGPKMLPRSSSPRLALKGSFAGAKVVKHPQWHKRLESDKLLGTVVRHGQTLEDKVNVRAAVEFSSGRERVDLNKIFCTLPGSGGFVYAGHLANLGDLERVNEGDNVLITATPAELEELHKRRGLWKPDMTKTFLEKGYVLKRTNTGDFTVTFHDSQETFRMNSAALRKIHPLSIGQLVRISDDIEMVKRLQSGHGGWTAAMKQAIGTVGKVVEIDGSDIHVKIKGNHKFVFNSVNLTPERFRAPKPDVDIKEKLRGVPRIMQNHERSIVLDVDAGDIKAVERILAIHPESVSTKSRI
eukprot:XP_011677565.1 PREDICTED: E3 ubiquitin-protein ligase MIB2-like [Strongylocentrotus purpuratus]